MKQFDPEKLKRAYPGMTEEFSARTDALIRSLLSRKEEPKMKKKMSLALAFALALMLLLTATAVAAGLGAFGQLATAHDPDRRLEDLDAVAAPVQAKVTAADGVATAIQINGGNVPEGVLVAEMLLRNGDKMRAVIGRFQVTEVGEFTFKRGEALAPEVTGAAMGAAGANKVSYYFA